MTGPNALAINDFITLNLFLPGDGPKEREMLYFSDVRLEFFATETSNLRRYEILIKFFIS